MRRTLERELKLRAGEGFELPDFAGEELEPRVFVSTYFDAPDLRLARAGVTLRHRTENGRGLWQQDVLGEHQDAVVAEGRIRALAARTEDPAARFAAGRLVERQRARRAAARADVSDAWERVERLGRRAL